MYSICCASGSFMQIMLFQEHKNKRILTRLHEILTEFE